MEVYIFACILSILISIVIEKTLGYKKKKIFKIFIALLPLTLVSAFRYDVGWDYVDIYTRGFYYVGKYNIEWFTEKGFLLMVKVLYYVFGNPISLFVLFSCLVSYFFCLCCDKYGKEENIWIYIFMFVISRYYFMSLNIMRQALAVMIILNALYYIKEKNFKKYILYIFIAFEIHYISIVYLPLYFLLSKKYNRIKDILFFIFVIPIGIIGIYCFVSSTKYANYFTSMFGNDGSFIVSEIIIPILIIAIRNLFINQDSKNTGMENIFFNMSIVCLIISLMSSVLPLGDRMIWYFSMHNMFYVPYLISNIKKQNLRLIIAFVIVVCFTIVCGMQTIWKDSYSIVPYHSIFEQDIKKEKY